MAHEEGDANIDDQRARLSRLFSETRSVVDFLLLVSMQVAVSTVFWLLLKQVQHEWLIRPVLGLIVVGLIGAFLFIRVTAIIELSANLLLSSIHEEFGLGFLLERHAVVRALWKATVTTVQIAIFWGLGFAVAELIRQQGIL